MAKEVEIDGEELYEEAQEELNESQAKELFELLEKLEVNSETSSVASGSLD